MGMEWDVKSEILKVPGVLSADITGGEQDIIALIEAPSYEEILNLVLGKIRRVNGVKSTTTNLILEEKS